MCDTVITFGQRGGYYFESPSKWIMAQLPSELQRLFNDKKVERTYCVVLGANESFVISYQGKDGLQHLQSRGIPKGLQEWLYAKDSSNTLVRNLDKLKISLGPYNESFFASDGSSWRWHNLPTDLQQAVEERADKKGDWSSEAVTPRLVVLGAHDNWVLINEGGGGTWRLGGYRELDSLVHTLGDREERLTLIHNLALDPHRLNAFVLQSPNGIVLWSHVAPHIEEALPNFEKAVEKDTQVETERKLEERYAGLRLATRQMELQRLQNELHGLERRRIQEMNQWNQLMLSMNALSLGALSVGSILNSF